MCHVFVLSHFSKQQEGVTRFNLLQPFWSFPPETCSVINLPGEGNFSKSPCLLLMVPLRGTVAVSRGTVNKGERKQAAWAVAGGDLV